uniref:Putative secreted protein n=1 Tax=Anopheles triannulatus TaxID=58253 RepID=A0A2M4B6A8_9DIPT
MRRLPPSVCVCVCRCVWACVTAWYTLLMYACERDPDSAWWCALSLSLWRRDVVCLPAGSSKQRCGTEKGGRDALFFFE